MIKWLTNLFSGTSVPEVINKVIQEEPKAETKTAAIKTKKTTKKPATKAAKVDVDNMSKKDLLAHAKKNGIKANASMNKDALVKAIKNG